LLAHCRWVLVRVVAAVAILCGLFALRLMLVEHKPLRFHPYWVSLLLTVPLTFWLFRRGLEGRGRILLGAVLLIDLWALAWPLVRVRPESDIYPLSESVRYLTDEQRPRGRVSIATRWSTSRRRWAAAPLAVYHGVGRSAATRRSICCAWSTCCSSWTATWRRCSCRTPT
jgi:hypothetical protein